ncbi:hypothetical protein KRX57_00820 [Weeksellaceae bacterium TAE3-ERU29]|nr:hypothetical protein [Weeksellaceae bacterium TAE3-ERU29]
MKKTIKKWQALAFIAILLMASCSSDDKPDMPDSNKKDVLIGTSLANNDGSMGAAYMQLIEGIEPQSYNNKRALPTFDPNYVIGDDIYSLPGWVAPENIFTKYGYENGELVEKAKTQLPASAGANSLAVKDNKIYVSYSYLGKIGIYDKNTLKHIKNIDISSYGVGDGNPDPCQMIVRDNTLFVALNQIVGADHVPDPTRAKVDVLLIDTKTDEVKKMITESSAGMSMPTVPETDIHSIFMDENKDIYINCISGFGFLGHKAGFLRIKNGEEDFDSNYQFDITSTPIEGEANKANYVVRIAYAGGGKVYATVNIPAYYSTPRPNWFEDETIFPVEIDLKAKTIKRLGTAKSTNFATAVGLYKDKVVFGLKTQTSNGFFVYDPTTGKMSDKAVINVDGYPLFFTEVK